MTGPADPAAVLANALADEMCHQTALSVAASVIVARKFVALGRAHGWTDAQIRRVAFECIAAGIHPDHLAGALKITPERVAAYRVPEWVVAILGRIMCRVFRIHNVTCRGLAGVAHARGRQGWPHHY